MKNWVQHKEKCIGVRSEVAYKSTFMVAPEPHIAIVLSEIMHDTEMSGRQLINRMLEFALEHMELESKTIKVIKFKNVEAQDEKTT